MSNTNPTPDDGSLPPSVWHRIDSVCDRFESAWRAKDRPALEDYLNFQGLPQSHRHALLRDLLIVELDRRVECGEQPTAREYEKRFPGCAEAIAQAFAANNSAATVDAPPGSNVQRRTRRFPAPHRGPCLHIRCPHCHDSVEIVAEDSFSDIVCSGCGSHFSLVDDPQETRAAETLKTIGHFELIERLGLGGFGSVWKARDTQLDRAVAVKIPRRGQLPPEEAEKFLREARAAAQLRHPNIVGVHEVGRDGETVYIVSDLVRGVPLSEWIEIKLPTPREAARLCLKICSALHHAHQKGIVHRDLKPQNIMLDDEGEPHLMDFGLARREAGEITMTLDGQLLGTPAYMSPEQARGEAHHADRRTDIYALGVILFQLLTGELPFRGRVRMLIHQVLHDEPPSPRKLNANIPRDLETISLKCLEKDRRRRYETAELLADDLNRFLHGEPILARPISTVARGWRWCQRKPVAATLIFLLCAISVLGPLVAIRMAVLTADARQATTEAQHATAVAENEKRQRERALNLLLQAFESPNPARDGRSITVAEVLDRALDTVATELVDDPYSQANLLATLGMTYFDLGLPRDAIKVLTQAHDLCMQELGKEHETTLTVTGDLAFVHIADPGAKKGAFIKQLEHVRNLMKDKLGVDDPRTIQVMNQLAMMYKKVYRHEDAVQVLEEVLEHCQSQLGEDHVDTLDCMTNLADMLLGAGQNNEALALVEIALPGLEAKLGADNFLTMKCLYTKGDAYHCQGRFATALPILEQVCADFRNRLGENHPETIKVMKKLALNYRALGRHSDDAKVSLEMLAHVRRSPATYEFGLMNALIYASQALFETGDLEQAETLARERLALARQDAPDHWATFEAESMLGSILIGRERFDEAESLVLEGYQGMIDRKERIPAEYLTVLRDGVERILTLYRRWDKPEQVTTWEAERVRVEEVIERLKSKS